jgi:outer membrane protein assembly factor BamB
VAQRRRFAAALYRTAAFARRTVASVGLGGRVDTMRERVRTRGLRVSRLALQLWPALLLTCALGVACGDDDDDDSDHEPGDHDEPKGGRDGGGGAGGNGGSDGAMPGDKPDASVTVDAGTASGDNVWAMMGYDAKNQYFNPRETKLTVANAPTLAHKWTATIAGFPPGTPAVASTKALPSATGGLYAFNVSDGGVAWMNLDIKGTSSVAYDDGFVYVHASGAMLYKLKAADGAPVWGPVKTYSEINGADGTSSPIVADGKVFVGHSTPNEVRSATPADQTNARGGVFAADAETGVEAWHYFTVELPENGAMVWSTVSVDLTAGVLYATTGNNYTVAGAHSDAFHAVDLASGAGMWSKQVREGDVWVLSMPVSQDTDFGANPILADFGDLKLAAAGDKASAFWAIDRSSGDIVWSRPDLTPSHSPANGGVLNNGAFDGKAFYVMVNAPATMTSTLYALNPKDGSDLWKRDFDRMTWGTLTVANGVLVVPVDTQLHVVKAADGAPLAMFETGGSIAAGGAAIVDGQLIVQSGLSYFGNPKLNNQVHCYAIP